MTEIIAKEKLTAFERWELGAFDASTNKAKENSTSNKDKPAVKLPTVEDVERIHHDAHRQGYAAGYEEGTARARMEALRLHTLVENLDQALKVFDQSVAKELMNMALELGRQVVRSTLKVHPEIIVEVVSDALSQLPHQHVAIFLHPEDASLVRTYLGDQLGHAGHRIFEDDKLERGGCRIDAAGSQLDASVPMRWRRVIEGLGLKDDWIQDELITRGQS